MNSLLILKHNHKLIAQEEALKQNIVEKQKVMNDTYRSLGYEGEVDVNNLENYYEIEDMRESITAYTQAVENYNNCVLGNQEAKKELQLYLERYNLELDAAETAKKNYQEDVDYYSSQKNAADKAYEIAKTDYLNSIASVELGQMNQAQFIRN